jgi:hypothetical protein
MNFLAARSGGERRLGVDDAQALDEGEERLRER